MQRADYPKEFKDWYFILFQGCQNCGLEGGGRIDGQGSLAVFGGCARQCLCLQHCSQLRDAAHAVACVHAKVLQAAGKMLLHTVACMHACQRCCWA
jgi:hypothetical protein